MKGNTLNTTAFIHFCEEQLIYVYSAIKQDKPDNQLKHRTEGLLMAGERLGVLSRSDAMDMVERAHLQVLGETVAARKQRKRALNQLKADSPDDYFDIPAIERRR